MKCALLTLALHLLSSQYPFNAQPMFKIQIRNCFGSELLFLLASHHWYQNMLKVYVCTILGFLSLLNIFYVWSIIVLLLQIITHYSLLSSKVHIYT